MTGRESGSDDEEGEDEGVKKDKTQYALHMPFSQQTDGTSSYAASARI